MGIDNSPLDVEESTEPPLRASSLWHGTKPVNQTAPSATTETSGEKGSDPDLHWDSQYQFAHTFSFQYIARVLGVDIQHGLSKADASSRLRRDGSNKVEGIKGISLWKIFLRQVSNSLTTVLVLTMALSFGIHDYIEGAVITVVILLNIIVGFVQDYRAEITIQSLHALSAPICKALRDGRIESVKAESLVVGDIVLLSVGDIVPADLRLVDGMNVSTEEALLTGESLPVVKSQGILPARNLPIGDRTNMLYSATTITQGRASGIVVSTAMKTEVGKIAGLLQEKAETQGLNVFSKAWYSFKNGMTTILGLVGTPLQVKLSKFALLLFALAIILAIIVFSANKWNVHGEVLIYGICVAVAVIPESLIAVLTITMAVGTNAMAKGNVIVRKLQALEAVGGVTNICSDKTGTLTQGRMIARKVWIPGTGVLVVNETTSPFDPTSGYVELNNMSIEAETPQSPALAKFLQAIALCNLSQVYCPKDQSSGDDQTTITSSGTWTAVGEPTEIALQVLAMRFNSGKPDLLEDGSRELVSEFPFDSALKKMTVVYKSARSGLHEAYTKGATEVILPVLTCGDKEKANIQAQADRMAGEGLRVLCVAHRSIASIDKNELSMRARVESDLNLAGLVGLYDPPRRETAEAVRKCLMAGISVSMLTGDHIRTATAIAYEVGILGTIVPTAQASTVVMQADVFDKLSDEDIDAMEALPLVLARCSPTTKVRMVEAMHRRNAFCVMTGDGVNDSPALKRADVGIAMGMNGSDVAKEAADMVLTDDHFASIVKAVEEGRRLFDNIQKFLMHLLVSNIAQVILLLVALAFKDGVGNSVFPLSPLEILWVNLITSSFLALGLGFEEAQPDIMFRPPHDLRVGIFTRELITDKMIYGAFMGTLCLVSFVSVVYGAGNSDLGVDCNQDWNETCGVVFRARATTYSTLSLLLLLTAWEVKHFSRSLFNLDPTRYSGPFAVFSAVWRNRFLFWAVIAGFVVIFPVVYIPVVNRTVFKHEAITWEWGVVFGCGVVYLALFESWKAVKRVFGIASGKNKTLTMEDAEKRIGLEQWSADEGLRPQAVVNRPEDR